MRELSLGHGNPPEEPSRASPPIFLRTVAVVASALLLVLLVACGPVGLSGGGEPTSGSGMGRTHSPAEASETLNGLEVAPPGSMTGYSREKFPHWSDAQEYGWDAPSSCGVRDAAIRPLGCGGRHSSITLFYSVRPAR